MSKVNMVTIVNKHNGFTRTIGEPEFNGMIDKADYNCTSVSDDGDGIPDDNWTVGDIKNYLDHNNIEYTGTHNTKSKLLALL